MSAPYFSSSGRYVLSGAPGMRVDVAVGVAAGRVAVAVAVGVGVALLR